MFFAPGYSGAGPHRWQARALKGQGKIGSVEGEGKRGSIGYRQVPCCDVVFHFLYDVIKACDPQNYVAFN